MMWQYQTVGLKLFLLQLLLFYTQLMNHQAPVSMQTKKVKAKPCKFSFLVRLIVNVYTLLCIMKTELLCLYDSTISVTLCEHYVAVFYLT
jgi:hypothetical protein